MTFFSIAAKTEIIEGPDGFGFLVPGNRPVGGDYRLFVTLSGEQNDIAGSGPPERFGDSLGSIGDEEQVEVSRLARGLRAERRLPRGSRVSLRPAGLRR